MHNLYIQVEKITYHSVKVYFFIYNGVCFLAKKLVSLSFPSKGSLAGSFLFLL